MKKRNFIALALVVAIALMGAGYAAWTDDLTVASTVKTGYLDVDFIAVTKHLGNAGTCGGVDIKHEITSDGVVDSCADIEPTVLNNEMTNRDKLLLTVTNLYPGAEVYATVTVQNTGTVPVKIKTSDIADKKYVLPKNVTEGMNGLIEENRMEILVEELDADGVVTTSGWGWPPVPSYITIAKGATKSFKVTFNLPTSADNSTQCEEFEYLFTLPFIQGDC